MIIKDLILELEQAAAHKVTNIVTCDTVKSGRDESEIKGIAVAMFATPQIIRNAAEIGANFLIVHEPVYYNHFDSEIPNKIGQEKRELIDRLGITIYRFHDHPHYSNPDTICEGMLQDIGLSGVLEEHEPPNNNRYFLDTPMTARELAVHLEKRLDIHHIKIAGCTDQKGRSLSLAFGAAAGVAKDLDAVDFVLTGETSEWGVSEIARDYSQMGYNKALLVMGHIGSERNGMMLIARRLQQNHPEIPVHYLECGEVYSYTDSPIL